MAENKLKDENYYQVQGWMINCLKLKGVPLNVYAIIYGFTQDGETEYTGSLQYLCDFTGGTTKPTIIKALKELVEKGYLLRQEEHKNGVQFNRYKVNLPLLKNFNRGSKEILTGVVKNFNGGSKEILPNNNIYKNNENKEDIIVAYLNSKVGTTYKASSKDTQKHINARLNEGYTIDDFKAVIDKQYAKWKGTEYEQYLRPSTLFGTKFENYLNAKATTQPQDKSSDSGKGWNGTSGRTDF